MMARRAWAATSAAALVGTILAAGPARSDLDGFMKRPEPVYRWEKRGEQTVDGCKIYDLHLVSQTWQGHVWEHRVQVFRPEKLQYPGFCALYNTGGGGSAGNTQMGVRLARDSGAVYAIVYGIPKQPLYGGLTEDALVVYTWLQYLKTGDESWPLHFPMAKGVIKAMDAIQEFTVKEGFPPITGFTVHGASKRGWTTYLVGATRDPRVKSIAPMVIDVLNILPQIDHQTRSYGALSEQVRDYTRVGITEKLKTPEGKKLLALADPYSYRDRLTLPKLLILGTNDRYWTQDSLNLYWDGLKGPKWVLYTPNSGHGLEDRERVFATLASFIRMSAGGPKWPRMSWEYRNGRRGTELHLNSDPPAKAARLFSAHAPALDFRDSRWTYEEIPRNGRGFLARLADPASGRQAVFGEAVYEIEGRPFTLSTQIRILGGGMPAP